MPEQGVLTSEDIRILRKLADGRALTDAEEQRRRYGDGLAHRLNAYLDDRTRDIEIATALATHASVTSLLGAVRDVLDRHVSLEERKEQAELARQLADVNADTVRATALWGKGGVVLSGTAAVASVGGAVAAALAQYLLAGG